MSLSKFVLSDAHGPLRRWCPESDRVRTSLDAIALRFSLNPQREPGGRGRIRTFVARKERQIYSLLVLATHPPVPQNLLGRELRVPNLSFNNLRASHAKTQLASIPCKNTKRTRVKRHQPVRFFCQDSLRPRSPENSWWSWRRELNPRPSDYKSDALPAELRQRPSNRVRIAEEV